jgi:hypothetical protein
MVWASSGAVRPACSLYLVLLSPSPPPFITYYIVPAVNCTGEDANYILKEEMNPASIYLSNSRFQWGPRNAKRQNSNSLIGVHFSQLGHGKQKKWPLGNSVLRNRSRKESCVILFEPLSLCTAMRLQFLVTLSL